MYNLKETGRRGEFSDGNEREGFMKATNLSDQEVQDTTQDHDASHGTHWLSTSPERVEVL